MRPALSEEDEGSGSVEAYKRPLQFIEAVNKYAKS